MVADVTCQRCASALDDPDRALREAASWTDVASCCEETLELLRMEQGMRRLLPDEEPPPYLDEVLLKAAAARIPSASKPPLPAVATSATLLGRLRRWVTAPQVAMAMITGLAMLIGVFFLPGRFRPMEAEGDTLVTLDGASTSAAPDVSQAPSDKPEADFRIEPAPTGSTSAASAPTAAPAIVAQAAPVEVAEVEAVLGDSEDLPSGADARRETADGRSVDDAVAADRMAGRGDTLAILTEERPTAGPIGGGARSTAFPSSPTRGAALGGTAPSEPAAAPRTAMTEASAPSDATSRLAQARGYRSRGQCAAAVPLYQQYLADPNATDRAEATLELGACLERTGHLASARSTYERATRMPPVASRARASLSALDAEAETAAAERSAEAERSESGAAGGAPAVRSSRPAASVDSTY